MYESIQRAGFFLCVSNQKSDEVGKMHAASRVMTRRALEAKSLLERGGSRKETVGAILLTQTHKQCFLAISNVQMPPVFDATARLQQQKQFCFVFFFVLIQRSFRCQNLVPSRLDD